MKELDEYRQQLIDRVEAAAKEFQDACLAVKDPHAAVEQGGWSVHQLAVHTRDTDKLVYGLRARRTLEEDNPLFQSFDGDAYMAGHYDPGESLRAVLYGLVQNVGSLTKVLRDLRPEGWSRESRHETQGGGLTLQTWVERGLEHINEHLQTVRKAR
jgi:DinB family protein